WDLVRCEPGLRPRLERLSIQIGSRPELDRSAYQLAPRLVRHADHRTFRDGRMIAQDRFDLQRRHLEAAGLDDVGARPSQESIRSVFDDGDIARPKPPVAERSTRLVGTPPVLEKHVRPLDFQLSSRARRHDLAVVANQADDDPGQWLTDK